MANPSGTNNQDGNQAPSSFNGNNPSNGNSDPSSGSSLKHNPGISTDWTFEEQTILEEGLVDFAEETNVVRYAKIAINLPNKTVRDVALRCRWMNKKEQSKRRKEDNLARRSRDKKERHGDPSAKTSNFMAARPSVSPFATPMLPLESEEGISYDAIGGVTGDLLKQNAQILNQISANLASFQIQENLNLLRRTRDNIRKIMNQMNDVPELMKQMPPLPVKLNDDLADTILLPPNLPRP
ncbi:hypothetical protein POPTR_007G132700v4 [Populus trichocarpa]|uniref:Myb-like domain-containing protein n=1 Tax=Populus trichocarpa TaxID=3694 RepID=B9HGY3_POPTR|nr:uncharacterized protein LOC7469578 [Populus trichocarpa]KAI5583008.1 hypothetical protein BDE02_07G123600 [Populus trichocarpa]PNT28690.1 hypothetical protein POPTR_007G132700v4 [Populus trichocarpa]|eukprot:XP_002309778.2 uncharacterized protein LOC7469578 [Populus trichocarpa]